MSLTPLGRERAKAAFVSAIEVNRIATDALKPEEREVFYDMLRRIIGALERDAGTE